MITLYGIKNCDTVKKARQWLDSKAITYRFHDFRNDGLSEEHLQHFLQQLDWEILLNKRSTTWKNLPEIQKKQLTPHSVVPLLLEYPTLIKRPVLDTGSVMVVGFDPNNYQTVLSSQQIL